MMIDVSTYQGVIDWPRVKAAGVDRVYIRGPMGALYCDNRFQTNWNGARAAGIPRRGIYCDVVLGQGAGAQAANILKVVNGDWGTLPLALDVERTEDQRKAMAAGWVWPKAEYTSMLHELVQFLSQQSPNGVAIYTSAIEWAAMTTEPEWARALPLWIAHYNRTIQAPDCPPGWDWAFWQYGQDPVAGILNPVDVNREKKVVMPQAAISTGSLIGIHSIRPGNTLQQLQAGVAAGRPWPGVLILNDPAAAAEYKVASPHTTVVCRLDSLPLPDEGMQDVVNWTAGQRSGWATRQLALILANANDSQIALVDGFICHNEPGMHGVDAWTALGQTWLELCHQAISLNGQRLLAGKPPIRLAIGGTAQGMPEWAEMVALVATGLFDLIHAQGWIWVAHEGVYGQQSMDVGYGDLIPGSPTVNGAGAYNMRWVYLFSLLLARGCPVRILFGEFYDGGGYPGDPVDHVARFGWYDAHLASLPVEYARWVIAFCGFTCNPDDHWMPISNYDNFYHSPELDAYRALVAQRQNGVYDMPVTLSDSDFAAFTAATAQMVQLQAKYAKHTMSNLTCQAVINVFFKWVGVTVFEAQFTPAQLALVYAKDAQGLRSALYAGPALEDMPSLTSAQRVLLLTALAQLA